MNILLTGSTGFVGQGLLHYFRYKKFKGCIHLTIRDKKGETAIQRFNKIKNTFPDLSLELCTTPIVELQTKQMDDIQCIINVAAAIDFNLEIRDALGQNVDGLKSLITFANRNENVKKFIHISTAYVSDPSIPLIKEEFVNLDKINPDAEAIYQQVKSGELTFEQINKLHFFPNTYCATKCIAEKIVELEIQRQNRIDYSIVRPSIITCAMSVPHNGWFQGYAAAIGLYSLLLEGFLPYKIGNIYACGNTVPIDYVCAVIYESLSVNNIHIQHATIQTPIEWGKVMYNTYYNCNVYSYIVQYHDLYTRFLQFIRMVTINIQYYLCFDKKTQTQIKVLQQILSNIDSTFYTFITNTYNFDIRRAIDFYTPECCNTPEKYTRSCFEAIIYKRKLFKLHDPTRQSYVAIAYNVWKKYFTFDYKNNVYYGILLIYAMVTQFILRCLYKNIIVEIDELNTCIWQTKPIVILSNHNSHMDTAILKYLFLAHSSLKLHNPIVIATDEFKKIDNPQIQRILSNTRIKYISREKFDKDDFIHFLKTEITPTTNILLFPEGTRSRDRSIRTFKSGIYDLMNKHLDFKVLPVSFAYSKVPETDGFVRSLCSTNNNKNTKLMNGLGMMSLLKLIFTKHPTDICCIKLDKVIQAPVNIQDIENIVIQNHSYLQRKYYTQLNMDCADHVKRYLNHKQIIKFETGQLEYTGPNFPITLNRARILYTEHRDSIINKYGLDIPKYMGDYKNTSDFKMPDQKYTLITGGTGLIGSNLIRRIVDENRKGHYILLSRSIQKNTTTVIGDCVFHTMRGDITDVDAIDDYEFKLWNLTEIFHFAGQVSHHNNRKIINSMIEANHKGTQNICKLVEINNKIHTTSKMNVTYMSTSGVLVKEAMAFPYYMSKTEAENHITDHAKKHGYNLTVYRPSMIIGEVDIEVLNKLNIKINEPKENFFNKVKNGNLKFCTDTCTNAISCKELIDCIMKAEYDTIKLYNCSGHNYKLIDIFNHYKQTRYTYLNPTIINLLLFITSLVNILPSLHYYMRMAQLDWTTDTSITCRDLGFKPKRLI